jgi:hypothetical protein
MLRAIPVVSMNHAVFSFSRRRSEEFAARSGVLAVPHDIDRDGDD